MSGDVSLLLYLHPLGLKAIICYEPTTLYTQYFCNFEITIALSNSQVIGS